MDMDPSVKLQKYEQGKCLGSGGQGSVYKTVRRVDGGIFAMKVLEAPAEKHKRNVMEVQHMLKLSHKNLIPCLDYFETTKQVSEEPPEKVWQVHIVMPLYAKGDLHSHILKEGPLSQERAERLLREMGEVLHYIHSEGFIHRDVKPLNIMVSGKVGTTPLSASGVGGEAEFILADLGLSKEVSSDGAASTLVGTPVFMAPDIRDDKYTNKVDMWALGVTVCHVVLQKGLRDLFLKYLHENRELVMGKLRTHLPHALGAPLCEVVLRLLSTDPLERPSASEMLQTGLTGIVMVLLAIGSVGGDERKRKLFVAVGAGAEEVRVAAAKAFSSGGQELLRVRRLEVFDKDFGEFVEEDDEKIVFEDKGQVRVVFEEPLPTTTSSTISDSRDAPPCESSSTVLSIIDDEGETPLHKAAGNGQLYGKDKGIIHWEGDRRANRQQNRAPGGPRYEIGSSVRALVRLEGDSNQVVKLGAIGKVTALPGANSTVEHGAVAEVIINGVRFDAQPDMIAPADRPAPNTRDQPRRDQGGRPDPAGKEERCKDPTDPRGPRYEIGSSVRALVRLEGDSNQVVKMGAIGKVTALPGASSTVEHGAVAEVIINGVRFDAQPDMIAPADRPVPNTRDQPRRDQGGRPDPAGKEERRKDPTDPRGPRYEIGSSVRALVRLEGDSNQVVKLGAIGKVTALPGANSTVEHGAVAEVIINGVRFDAQPDMIAPADRPAPNTRDQPNNCDETPLQQHVTDTSRQ